MRRSHGAEYDRPASPAPRRESRPVLNVTRHESEYTHAHPRLNDGGAFPRSQQSPHVSATSPETERSASRVPALSHLLHLSHDPVPNDEPGVVGSDPMLGWRGIDAVCADLEISADIYPCL